MWKIKAITDDLDLTEKRTILFACEEMKKYLSMVTEQQIYIAEMDQWDGIGIALGKELSADLPSVEDKKFDDAIAIDVKDKTGVITGSNARSVLIAMYRYLRELGFLFIRPGKYGEIIPETLSDKDVRIIEAATSRHRCICNEGAIFYECAEDIIDWLPKVGLNAYYIQFFNPKPFYERWYDHCHNVKIHPQIPDGNPYLPAEAVTDAEFAGMFKMHLNDMEKRGIMYYGVGHGWHCVPFGIPLVTKREKFDLSSIPPEVKQYFAMKDGERKINKTVNFTQMCYGNPVVVEKMAEFIADYCEEHKNFDVASLALADGTNNYCECELCKNTRPSDHLINICNAMDEKLTERNLDTKIAFSAYVDLMWPPLKGKLNNPDRFIMQLCPITRTYSKALSNNTSCEMKEYVRNKLEFPSSIEELMPYFIEWRKAFPGESIVFDYYYMWDCYRDLGRVQTSRIIYEDIKNYKDMDISGLISCQAQRVFAPTSLGMNIMARTLWNRNCDFEEEMEDIWRSEFGKGYEKAGEYLKKMSYYAAPEVMRLEKWVKSEENEKLFKEGYEYNKAFYDTLDEQIEKHEGVRRVSWKYLKLCAYVNQLMLEAYIRFSKGNTEFKDIWDKIDGYINETEWEFRHYLDSFEYKFMIICLFNDLKLELETGNLRNGGDVTDGGVKE